MGLRDSRQSYAKPPGTFRVLALGDSYLEAAQVQAPETAAARLEVLLGQAMSPPVEVINAGVFGYGTAQELILLDEEVKYQPDLVLLFFCHCNDIANNSYRLELIDGELSRALKPYYDLADDEDEPRLIPPPPPSPRTSLRERLRDLAALQRHRGRGRLQIRAAEPEGGVQRGRRPGRSDARQVRREADGEWERAWRITDALIERLRDRAEASGARLAIVGIPEWRMLETAYWQRDANKRLVESGRGGPGAPVKLLDGIARRLGVRTSICIASTNRASMQTA